MVLSLILSSTFNILLLRGGSLIDQNDLNYIQQQEEILAKMQEKIKLLPNKNMESLKELEISIEQLNNEVKSAKSEDVPSIMYQLNILHSLADKLMENNAFPDSSSPYFGHLKIEQDKKQKDLYLGHCGLSDVSMSEKIIDWKRAPIAKVFYQYDAGEEFDLDLEDREVGGKVIEKAVLTIINGELKRVDRNRKSYVLNQENKWVDIQQDIFELSGGEESSYGEFGTGRTNYQSADVLSLLDKTQFELVNRDSRMPLLIIGSAGSGKTTVALYRLAQLIQQRKVFPNQSLVLVPNNGLVKLSQALLEKVGIRRVGIQVLQDWIENAARRVFPKLPKSIHRKAPLYVQIIKRSHFLYDSIDALLNDQLTAIDKRIQATSDQKYNEFLKYADLPMIPRLKKLLETECSQMELMTIHELIDTHSNVREDLYHLFTGDKYLNILREKTEGKITSYHTKELKIYQTKLSTGYDQDREYLESQGLEQENSDSLDEEDFILLLLLARKKWGSIHSVTSPIKSIRHLLLDEAQEVHPFELEIISEIIHEKASVTVAGDAAQQIDEAQSFLGWEDVMARLGYEDVTVDELNVSYRSPENITKLAHHVLGPLAPKELPDSIKVGGKLIETQVQHSAHGALELTNALRELTVRERKASIAIICSRMDTAREYYEILSELGNVRLIDDADFPLKPGIDITVVEHIRGLEFDYVIMPDVNAQEYPINPRARKRLHLGITRAIHQLWIMYNGQKSALLP